MTTVYNVYRDGIATAEQITRDERDARTAGMTNCDPENWGTLEPYAWRDADGVVWSFAAVTD